MKFKLLFFIPFACAVHSFAQENIDLGFLPKVVLSNQFNERVKWVNSLESRTFVYDDAYQFTHSLIDLSSIFSLKTGFNQSFNFGYILRFRNAETIHRTFQHYNVVQSFTALKFGHRLAFEQFYQTEKSTTYRARYRVVAEKPLNGDKVDVKEFYLKMGNEYLYDFEALEVRFTPYLGYRLSRKDRIEFGLDYRISNFTNNATQNDIWFRTTWYIRLN